LFHDNAEAVTKGPDPDAILRDLYKTHDAQKGPFFDRKNRNLVERYFTKELAALIVKDAGKSNDEIGAYDFDPLYASQDPQVKNFKIGAVQRGGISKRAGDHGDDASAFIIPTTPRSCRSCAPPIRNNSGVISALPNFRTQLLPVTFRAGTKQHR
jgi:hypothetical protein